MSQQQTSVAERNHFVDLRLQGYTLQEIAEATGWSFESVRSWWCRYRDGGRSALDPDDGRKQRGGRMRSFSTEIRGAFSEIKENHPRWGAAVARARIREQMDIDETQLPSASTIEKYWAEKHPQLLRFPSGQGT